MKRVKPASFPAPAQSSSILLLPGALQRPTNVGLSAGRPLTRRDYCSHRFSRSTAIRHKQRLSRRFRETSNWPALLIASHFGWLEQP
jgi:hypothetical protein